VERGSTYALELNLAADLKAPRAVREALRAAHIGEADDNGVLVASELVAHVVRLSGLSGEVMLQVRANVDGGVLRICVQANVSGSDRERHGGRPEPADELGLRIVERLAERWEVESSPQYRIWAEVALS
jgi:hypothetical protein